MKSENSSGSTWVLTAGGLWLTAALAVGAAGLVQQLRPPLPQVVLFGLTALLLTAGWALPTFRRWAVSVDLRVVPAFHLTRFVGAYFLVLYSRGELPYSFGVGGGIGDIITATFAIVLLATGAPHDARSRGLWFAWNTLGLVDILLVVAAAASSALSDPASMAPLLVLPLSLLPTFVVPIIIASHVLVYARLSGDRQPIGLAQPAAG